MIGDNIVLIGMPSAGKSTIGELLAADLHMGFVDTDALMIKKTNRRLRDIINEDGLSKFLEIQEATVLEINVAGHVVATGGSVVYSEAAMKHLKSSGRIVYLRSTYEEIEQRVAPDRRFARNESQSLKDIYDERIPLYEKYADITIDCSSKPAEEIAAEICSSIKNGK